MPELAKADRFSPPHGRVSVLRAQTRNGNLDKFTDDRREAMRQATISANREAKRIAETREALQGDALAYMASPSYCEDLRYSEDSWFGSVLSDPFGPEITIVEKRQAAL